MNERDVKETMDQIHISKKMQEEIIMNVQNQMGNGKRNIRVWKKVAVAAVAFILVVGVASVPVRALVDNLVKARMENIPKESLEDLTNMLQNQRVNAASYSREYSEKEEERIKELWKSYEDGMFPEKEILQVENKEDAEAGVLCYVRTTGEYCLPERELTDEEILEMIDFDHTMCYAIDQSPAAQAAREEYLENQERLEEQAQEYEDGIDEEKAKEIALACMKEELGEAAEGKELLTVFLQDITERDFESKGDVAYTVGFGNPKDHSTYTCIIDAADGSVLKTKAYSPQ